MAIFPLIAPKLPALASLRNPVVPTLLQVEDGLHPLPIQIIGQEGISQCSPQSFGIRIILFMRRMSSFVEHAHDREEIGSKDQQPEVNKDP